MHSLEQAGLGNSVVARFVNVLCGNEKYIGSTPQTRFKYVTSLMVRHEASFAFLIFVQKKTIVFLADDTFQCIAGFN